METEAPSARMAGYSWWRNVRAAHPPCRRRNRKGFVTLAATKTSSSLLRDEATLSP